jgi:hypothetical protein
MADNSEFAKEFLAEYNDPKKSKKSLGRAIGLPDKEDEEFLKRLVAKYEAENPGWLTYIRNEGGLVNKGSSMTYDFELPVTFYREVERYYPMMFRDADHYRWFKKTFIALMIRPNEKRKTRGKVK